MKDRSVFKPRSIPATTTKSSPVVPVGSWKRARRESKQSQIVSRSPKKPIKIPKLPVTSSPTRTLPWRVIFLTVLISSLTIAWLFWNVGTSCLTHQFTTCSSEEVAFLQLRYRNRWSVLVASNVTINTLFKDKFIETENINLKIRLLGANSAVITKSQPVATIKIGDSWYQALTAGQLRAVNSDSYPQISFADQNTWNSWIQSYANAKEGTKALESLFKQSQTYSPRILTIQVISANEAVLRLENSTRVIVSLHSAEELNRQLHTLQAVFSASTMEKLPNEVDVRFKNVIIRN